MGGLQHPWEAGCFSRRLRSRAPLGLCGHCTPWLGVPHRSPGSVSLIPPLGGRGQHDLARPSPLPTRNLDRPQVPPPPAPASAKFGFHKLPWRLNGA